MASMTKRINTLKKKTFELATLCGIDAVLIVLEDDGPNSIGHRQIKPQTWPESPDEVRRILKRYSDYKDSSPPERKRRKIDVVGHDGGRESEMAIENLTWEDGVKLLEVLDSKLLMVQQRIQELEKKGIPCSTGTVTDSEHEAISLSEFLMSQPDDGMGMDALLLQSQPWVGSDETDLSVSHMWMNGLDDGMGLHPLLDIEDAPPLMDSPDQDLEGLGETAVKKPTHHQEQYWSEDEPNFSLPELWIDGADSFPSDATLYFSQLMKDSDFSL